jgi:hypothetical protein
LEVLAFAVKPGKSPVPLAAFDDILLHSPVAVHSYVTAGEVIDVPNVIPFISLPLHIGCEAVAGISFIFGSGLTVIVNSSVSVPVQSPIFGLTFIVALYGASDVLAFAVKPAKSPVPLAAKPIAL